MDARNSTNKETNWVKTYDSTTETLKGDETIFCINIRSLHVKLELNHELVPFEVDIRATQSL